MEVPNKISNEVLSAITSALKEEKVPLHKRILKILGYSTGTMATLFIVAYLALNRHVTTSWILAFGTWWIILTAAFIAYWKPAPRLAIRGNFSPWVMGKILISMTIATILELIICPSFVVAHLAPAWSPFGPISDAFMSWGGMAGCMFLCGLIFVGLGASFTFLLVKKTLSGSSTRNFMRAAGIAYLTQVPIIGIQLFDDGLRSVVHYWIFGSVIGLLATEFLVRFVSKYVRR